MVIVWNSTCNLKMLMCNVWFLASITTTQGLEWTFNIRKFNIIGKNLPKNSQNIALMLGTTPFIANDFQGNDELIDVTLNHKIAFIDLCDFFDEDKTLPIFEHLFNSSLLILTCSLKILSTCCLKFTFLFLMSWNVSRQCLLLSMPPRSWKNWIMIHFGLKMLLAFHPLLMVMFSLNSPLLIIQMAILARWHPFLDQGQNNKYQEWFRYMNVNWNRRKKWNIDL